MKHVFTIAALFVSFAAADPRVKTPIGHFCGITQQTKNGERISAFLGIPYAEPPIGEYRFRKPVPKKRWNGDYPATKEGNQCTQPLAGKISGDEDCLKLNVYTPWTSFPPGRFHKRKPLHPVMVYIHGGGFTVGNGSSFDTGPYYLLDKKVLLVTLNYRLGIFGFLSTGSLEAPGNYGLKDQVMALRWVRDNIESFGGNPRKITIFGESAGGVCVNLHALSTSSKDLFDQFLIQSGSALNPWAFRLNPDYYELPKQVATMYNCRTENLTLMMDCLRQLSTFQLYDTSSIFSNMSRLLQIQWGPTVEPEHEDAFITDSPAHLISKREMKDCPTLTGVVKNEGLYVTTGFYIDQILFETYTNQSEVTIKKILEFYGPAPRTNYTKIAEKVKQFYLDPQISTDEDGIIFGFTSMMNDMYFFYPQNQMLDHMRNNSAPYYFYSFDYRGTFSHTSLVTGNNNDYGVAHADDLTYIFPLNATSFGLSANITNDEEDYQIVDLMVDLWTSFAFDGVPKSDLLRDPNMWKPYSECGNYLDIGNYTETTVALRNNFKKQAMEFWYRNAPMIPFGVDYKLFPNSSGS